MVRGVLPGQYADLVFMDTGSDTMGERLYQCGVAGDAACGKTTFLRMAWKERLIHEYNPTIGADMIPFRITHHGKDILLLLGSGAKRDTKPSCVCSIEIVSTLYFSALPIFSHLNLDHWMEFVNDVNDHSVEGAIIGTHDDRPREVSKSVARAYANRKGMPYYECCTYDLTRVNNIMDSILDTITTGVDPREIRGGNIDLTVTNRECCKIA